MRFVRSSFRPLDAASAFAPLGAPWWVAGGWALDLFAGGVASRDHEDLDVAIFRADERAARAALPRFEFFPGLGAGVIGERAVGADESPAVEVPALWARERASAEWVFEFLLCERAGDDWVFGRDPRVRRPVWSIGRATPGGVPFLAPEIVLLHKAKRARDVDALDLRATLPRLSRAERRWLRDALDVALPGHAWAREVGSFEGVARPIAAWETRRLRQRVLRPAERAQDIVLPGDDAPESAHFGAFVGLDVVATASVVHQPESEPDFGRWRLRGVATDSHVRGRGLAVELVRACWAHAREQGADVVWWNTTRDVVPWYEKLGATSHFEFPSPTRGTYVRMSIRVGAAPA